MLSTFELHLESSNLNEQVHQVNLESLLHPLVQMKKVISNHAFFNSNIGYIHIQARSFHLSLVY